MGKSVGGCYAEAFAKRVGQNVWGVNAPRRFFGDKHWAEPLKWNKKAAAAGQRLRVFCASMADVFEDRRDLDSHRARLWKLIVETPHLDWLLLTKRPEHMLDLAPAEWRGGWPWNIWAGTTAENQHYYNLRWGLLRRVPAAIRFISHEPAIGPLTIKCAGCGVALPEHGVRRPPIHCPGIFPDQVITGGESGGGPRQYHVEWARSLIAQTRGTSTACFVKQLGANAIDDLSGGDSLLPVNRRLRLVDDAGADPAEWPPDLDVREWPRAKGAA